MTSSSPFMRWLATAAAIVVMCLPPADSYAKKKPDTLVQALQRERALWRAELDALQESRRKITADATAANERLRQKVDRARSRYTTAWSESAQLERELRELDAMLESSTLRQDDPLPALEALEAELGLEAGDAEVGARIERALEASGARIVSDSRITRADGAFFTKDGAQTTGTVFTIGRVGALGVDAKGRGGPLAPTPADPKTLQVLDPAGDAVRAYQQGSASAAPVLFFDPRNPPDPATFDAQEGPDKAPERTWRDTIEDAAPIGYVILALGAFALLVLVLKSAALLLYTMRERRVGGALLEVAHGEGGAETLDRLERQALAQRSALARVTLQALSHRDLPLELYENSVQAVLLVELGRISRGLSALRTIAAVAPLLGLLGTVVGMTATFEALTLTGQTGQTEALSGGIAQALATTQIGLIVAVPSLLAYGSLRSWSQRMEGYIEHIAIELTLHIREPETHTHHHHHGHDHHGDEEGSS